VYYTVAVMSSNVLVSDLMSLEIYNTSHVVIAYAHFYNKLQVVCRCWCIFIQHRCTINTLLFSNAF
jgi:hypothetical protein